MLPLVVLSTDLRLDLEIDVLTVIWMLGNDMLARELLREELWRGGDDFLVFGDRSSLGLSNTDRPRSLLEREKKLPENEINGSEREKKFSAGKKTSDGGSKSRGMELNECGWTAKHGKLRNEENQREENMATVGRTRSVDDQYFR